MLEVVSAMVILSVLLMVGISQLAITVQGVKNTQRMFSWLQQHRAMHRLMGTLPANTARTTLCGGHPYRRYNPTSRTCEAGPRSAPPEAHEMSALSHASDEVLNWPTRERVQANGLSSVHLGEKAFERYVRPALMSAGCVSCHNGSAGSSVPANLQNFNILNYQSVVLQRHGTHSGPMASRSALASALGTVLMRPVNMMRDMSPHMETVTHLVRIGTEPLQLTSSRAVNYDQQNTSATCPQTCGVGEAFQDGSCTSTLLSCDPPSGKKGKKGGAGTCYYQHRWVCRVIDRTQLNDEWSRAIVRYSITSSWLDDQAKRSRLMTSEGVLQ